MLSPIAWIKPMHDLMLHNHTWKQPHLTHNYININRIDVNKFASPAKMKVAENMAKKAMATGKYL